MDYGHKDKLFGSKLWEDLSVTSSPFQWLMKACRTYPQQYIGMLLTPPKCKVQHSWKKKDGSKQDEQTRNPTISSNP
jgi:hypothetical protein